MNGQTVQNDRNVFSFLKTKFKDFRSHFRFVY